MRGDGKGGDTYVYIIPVLIAIFIFAYVWFVPPEYREQVLGIYPMVETRRAIPVGKWIGEPINIQKRFVFYPNIYVKYISKTTLVENKTIELKSNVFSTAYYELYLKDNQYLKLIPISIDGNLVLEVNGNRREIRGTTIVNGPARVRIINELKMFQFSGKSIVKYEIYEVYEEKEAMNSSYTFDLTVGGLGYISLVYDGNCDVKVIINGEEKYDGDLSKIDVIDAKLNPGENTIEVVANKNSECFIKEIQVLIENPYIPKTYETTFGYFWNGVNIVLDIEDYEGDPKIIVKFVGKKEFEANLTLSRPSFFLDESYLGKTNNLKIIVEGGRIYLKKIILAGE